MRLSIFTFTASVLLPFMASANEIIHDRELIASGTAGLIIDGIDTNNEWDGAFLADMHQAGDSTKPVLAQAYAKYDANINKLCVFVKATGGNTIFGPGLGDAEHYVKLGTSNGSPKAVAFPGSTQTFDSASWEQCYLVDPSPCALLIHSQIDDGEEANGQTSKAVVATPSEGAYVCGDPHLQSWGGVKWDYHGECDLVAIRNRDFADGKGLELHVRTTRDHHYSFTNEAALKIGDDVFEVHSLSEYKLNGEFGDYTNKTTDTLGGFPLSHWHSGNRDNLFFHRHVVDLGETGEKIEIKTFENIVYVEIGGSRYGMFKGSAGLFGDADSGKLIGRDGETEYEPSDEYALEWQVRDTDPKLFSNVRAPVYPEKCYPPKKFVPRLGFLQAQKQAEELCAAWDGDKESCVFDVLASGNKDLAQFKVMDAEAKAAALEEK